ncbi:MAG: PKD domain-containing protein [Anaerolineales bacterium]
MRQLIHRLALIGVTLGTMALPVQTYAQTGLAMNASATAACDLATFALDVSGGSGSYDLTWGFGDSENLIEPAVATYPHALAHTYPGSGEYPWTVLANDASAPELTGLSSGTLVIGPSVSLTSDIFPPVLTLQGGQASLTFTATAAGGEPPYAYAWDLDGDGTVDPGSDPASSVATFVYTSAGTFTASLTVTDNCGLTATDTLTVVVFDLEAACHPRALQIAQAVETLFPGQASKLYSCEDIFSMFNGGLTGSQLGFGRMWHAYQLAVAMEELTWEEILDWHLNGTGWGLLTQLDRFADALGEIDLRQLYEMVMAGEASVQDIRTAVQAAARFGADFTDALDRLAEGATPGELSRFYRTAQDLEIDASTLDAYLDSGISLTELAHAGRVAERHEADLELVASAHAGGQSWGEIGQAYRLADGETSADEILALGAHAFREQERVEDQEARQAERETRLAARLAEQYGVTLGEVDDLLGACAGDWSCAREALRAHEDTSSSTSSVQGPAERISRQFGVSVDAVWSVFYDSCAEDWSCVRRHFRESAHPNKHP